MHMTCHCGQCTTGKPSGYYPEYSDPEDQKYWDEYWKDLSIFKGLTVLTGANDYSPEPIDDDIPF